MQAALEELERAGTPVSVSKICALSGLHRKEIPKLLESLEGIPKGVDNLISRIVTQWQRDPRFSNRNRPRVLEAEGRDSEFAQLVSSVSKDISAYAVMYEQERLGYIQRTKKGLKLVAAMHVLSSEGEEALGMLARDCEHLVESVAENIFSDAHEPNLHLTTEFDKIAVDSVPTIRLQLLKRGSLFHKKLSAFLSKYDLDTNPKLDQDAETATVVCGLFARVIPSEPIDEESKATT